MILRGARGLGDSVYMYPVLKYYLEHGQTVEILTNYSEIYSPLKKLGLIISDRNSKQPDRECRYAPRYPNQSTTTYQDTLFFAGINEKIPLKIEYECKRHFEFKTNKKICVIRAPVFPMNGRPEGYRLIPRLTSYQTIIDAFSDQCYFVLAGNRSAFKFDLKGINEDLTGQLGISDLLRLIDQSEIVLTQSAFFHPFSEALGRRAFLLFAEEGMITPYKFHHYITPKKIINRNDIVGYAIDTEAPAKIIKSFERVLNVTI
jgi:hypothetical protein